VDDAKRGMENALRANPLDVREGNPPVFNARQK
jgi:hypothetical protein